MNLNLNSLLCDARVRGFVMEDLDVISVPNTDDTPSKRVLACTMYLQRECGNMISELATSDYCF